MKNALKLLLLGCLIGISCLNTAKSQSMLIDMGTNNFVIDTESTTVDYSQSPTSLTISPSVSFGSTLAGLWNAPMDWSSFSLTNFGVIFSITGANPELPFSLELYSSSLDVVNTFEGFTIGATNTPTFIPLSLQIPGTGDMSDIAGAMLTFNEAGNINMQWDSIAVVPEPKTIGLLLSSLLILGFQPLKKFLNKK
jgi:hypothetical protein